MRDSRPLRFDTSEKRVPPSVVPEASLTETSRLEKVTRPREKAVRLPPLVGPPYFWWIWSPWFTEIKDHTDKREQQNQSCYSDQPERGSIVSHSVGLTLKRAGSQRAKLRFADAAGTDAPATASPCPQRVESRRYRTSGRNVLESRDWLLKLGPVGRCPLFRFNVLADKAKRQARDRSHSNGNREVGYDRQRHRQEKKGAIPRSQS